LLANPASCAARDQLDSRLRGNDGASGWYARNGFNRENDIAKSRLIEITADWKFSKGNL